MDAMERDFSPLPSVAAWRLMDAYDGFEIAHFTENSAGTTLTGTSIGVETSLFWEIHYSVELDKDWCVRSALVTAKDGSQLHITADGKGRIEVNGVHEPQLDGCLDLDFEFSAVTNTAPVHRLALQVGATGQSSAAYVRASGLDVERLEQTYLRLPDNGQEKVFDYSSPRFDYYDKLRFGADGLISTYPQIASRIPT